MACCASDWTDGLVLTDALVDELPVLCLVLEPGVLGSANDSFEVNGSFEVNESFDVGIFGIDGWC